MKNAYYADFIWYDSQLYKDSWLLVDCATVCGISHGEAAPEGYMAKIFKNSAIFPGLINTHTHLAMSLFRGFSDDKPLMTWLNDYIWPAEKKYVSYNFVYNATMLSLAESIHSGVTATVDSYFFPNAAAQAFSDVCMRGVIGFGVMGSAERAFKSIEQFEKTNLLQPSLAPHAIYTVPYDIIKECVVFAKDKNILLNMHLAETLDEERTVLEKYGRTPVEVVDSTGAFDIHAIFPHCVHLSASDIKLLGEKNVNVSICLESNMKLASGFPPVSKLMKAGANISVGTDSAASNNDQSMIGEMSTVSKFYKAFDADATALSAEKVLDMATVNAGKVIGGKIGTLKDGYGADFFVLSFDSAHMTPVYNPVSHLVYTATPNDVTDVFINGKHIMADRVITTLDEEKIKQQAREKAKTL